MSEAHRISTDVRRIPSLGSEGRKQYGCAWNVFLHPQLSIYHRNGIRQQGHWVGLESFQRAEGGELAAFCSLPLPGGDTVFGPSGGWRSKALPWKQRVALLDIKADDSSASRTRRKAFLLLLAAQYVVFLQNQKEMKTNTRPVKIKLQ